MNQDLVWFEIKDKMPPKRWKVLLSDGNKYGMGSWTDNLKTDWGTNLGGWIFDTIELKPTHWSYLPKHPKTTKHEMVQETTI